MTYHESQSIQTPENKCFKKEPYNEEPDMIIIYSRNANEIPQNLNTSSKHSKRNDIQGINFF